MGSSRRAALQAAHAWLWPAMLVVLVLVLVLPLLEAGATQPGERLSSREVLARARERMAGAELGSLMTKTTTARKGSAKPTTTTTAGQPRDADQGGAEEAAKEVVVAAPPEVDMNANTAKVMFETIRRMNPGLAPLREQLPGQQPPQQQQQQQAPHAGQHKNSLGSKVKAALGGKAVTRRVTKKPLPALARHAAASSYERLRELLGDNDPKPHGQQQVAPATLSDPGAPAEPAVVDTPAVERELQQHDLEAAESRENSALHALLQVIELKEEHSEAEAEEQPRFTEVFGEPSGEEEEEEAVGGRGGQEGIHNEELASSAPPPAPRSAAERAEEAALLERLMEAYAAYAALRKEPPPLAFDVPMDLGLMPTADRPRAGSEDRDPRQLQRGDTTIDNPSSSSSPHLAVLPAAAEVSPEPLLT